MISIKFYASIHLQINGLRKQICQLRGMVLNLFGLKIGFGRLQAGNHSQINCRKLRSAVQILGELNIQLPRARQWSVAWVANRRIYVGGGHNGSFLNSIEFYDPQ